MSKEERTNGCSADDTFTDEQGLVRAVSLRMPTGSTLDRPIDKLVLLLEAEERPGIPDKEPRDLNT